jgi:hypothetical protein
LNAAILAHMLLRGLIDFGFFVKGHLSISL